MSDPTSGNPRASATSLNLGKPQSGWRRVAVWSLSGAALLLVAALAWVWLQRSGSAPLQPITQPAKKGDLVVNVTATGTLAPTNQVDVGIEVSGTVKQVLANYNDRVRVGQTLARLDTTKLEAQRRQTAAALESARTRVAQTQATVKEAQEQLARMEHVKVLSQGKLPAQRELDSARATLDRGLADLANARASVHQSEAALFANDTDLAKAVVRSSINGMVLKRNVEPGQTVAAAFQAPVLFTLAEDLTKMELQVDVDEADVGQVRDGQAARFTVDAYPDRDFNARVTQVRYGSQTVSGVVTYKTILQVDNRELLLRPGMTATAHVTVLRRTDVLLVPNAALRFTPPAKSESAKPAGGAVISLLPQPPAPPKAATEEDLKAGRRVWVQRDGKLVAVPVTVGASDGAMSEVTSGDVKPGTALVVDLPEAAP